MVFVFAKAKRPSWMLDDPVDIRVYGVLFESNQKKEKFRMRNVLPGMGSSHSTPQTTWPAGWVWCLSTAELMRKPSFTASRTLELRWWPQWIVEKSVRLHWNAMEQTLERASEWMSGWNATNQVRNSTISTWFASAASEAKRSIEFDASRIRSWSSSSSSYLICMSMKARLWKNAPATT